MEEQQKGETPNEAIPTPAPDHSPTDAEKLALAAAEIEKYKDLLLRKAAEFENYKRRSENESAAIIRFANEDLISAILPIVDDFERSLKHGQESKDFDALYRGIELIYQKMTKALESQGVKALETMGKEFSVEFHDALMQLPRTDVAPHTVIEELEKGYTLRDKVVRHAKVIVASAPSTEESAATPQNATEEAK
jgi:molecular chaperone GrpE